MKLTDEQIKHMVDRFLGWELPRDTFNPDCGISFDKEPFNVGPTHTLVHEPRGTNLLDAQQADTMVRYMIEGMLEEKKSGVVADLRAIHSVLDAGLGDSDVTHIESDEELRERHPFQWAAERLAGVIQKLER